MLIYESTRRVGGVRETSMDITYNHGGLHNAQGVAAEQDPPGWQRHLDHSSGMVVARNVMEMRCPSSEQAMSATSIEWSK